MASRTKCGSFGTTPAFPTSTRTMWTTCSWLKDLYRRRTVYSRSICGGVPYRGGWRKFLDLISWNAIVWRASCITAATWKPSGEATHLMRNQSSNNSLKA